MKAISRIIMLVWFGAFSLFVAQTACVPGSATSLPAPISFDNTEITVGGNAHFVTVGDVNHDGKLDIIAADATGGTVTVLLGDGTGRFQPAPGSPFKVGPTPNDIAIGDFNGDGNPDLVIPNHGTPYVTVMLGDGKGGFQPAPGSPFTTGSHPHPHGVAVADFNGDGKQDVAIDSWGNNQIELLLGDGAGRLVTPGRFFNVGYRPYQRLRCADFNKDGRPDVVTTNLDGDSVTILLGDGKGGFLEAAGSPFSAGAKPWAVAVGDINKDGNPDLVIVPYGRDVKEPSQVAITVLLGNGKGSFTPMRGSPLALNGCHNPSSVATGDLNGDGFRDIVVTCMDPDNASNLMVFIGSKDGIFHASAQQSPATWGNVAIADLNGDGKDDMIVANGDHGTITVFLCR